MRSIYAQFIRSAFANMRRGRMGRPFGALTAAAAAGGGGTVLLAVSIPFSSSKKVQETASLLHDGPKVAENIVREADVFYNAYMIENCYQLLNQYRTTEDPEILWRYGRVICEKGKMSQDPNEKVQLFKKALEVVEGALQKKEGSKCFGVHKYAIILNYVSEMEGSKAMIKSSYEVKAHLERALEIEPLDATTWHILGVWHFSCADLSSVSRYTAKVLFGTPPTSTYEEALRHFERAEAISPGFYSANQYYMGLVYHRLHKREEAIYYLKQAFMAPVVSVDDGLIHQKAFDNLHKHYGITAEQLMTS